MNKHLVLVPFTGLGLYQGFRGNNWLRNRIQIFKQFVIPSLLNQSCQDFTVWIAWRPEEKRNRIVKQFQKDLEEYPLDVVHTFTGCPIYDDKYPPEQAYERLITAIHGAVQQLVNTTSGASHVLVTLQPSDDCYVKDAFAGIQKVFKESPTLEAFGFTRGYVMNYRTLEVREWNPATNPPFYTIKYPRSVFINPLEHVQHIALKEDAGDYKKGTPLPSHEYVKYCLRYGTIDQRGFLVGTHYNNISTAWDNPFRGEPVNNDVLKNFGLDNIGCLSVRVSIFNRIFFALPHGIKRKLRYWAEKKIFPFNVIYSLLRN